ncbi:hypothetical protein [Cutibacterium avidum]|uniref:hypothetical protein n=1 Tax=Cutibacterium avidum TaxID=33010 RepID=UPI0003B8DC2F|nr:hypothetical protein [Cutibacterium avidum]ERS23419.1 hypothetical protein HMPREF1301_01219 [Propionibacterium sp. KPL2005]ERS30100.1 hypothetical protein HMPREF1297_00927 [Propionibacterium sp. KPL2000]ERS40749.1 hypothetical protein HMPREF1271_00371 [Propionibacterium sp. KPL1838]ERS68544.1 hypothetical protein HMPREF1279_00911 [Propionibacterium sp. KPL1852]MCG7369807.1 hypothetical protein [Cutibacterium avidum]
MGSVSRSCRRWWRVVVGVLVLLVVAEVPLAIGVLRPRLEPVPRRTDVVYAIGPADFHMVQARDLMRRTGASTLVVTISVDPRTGEEYRKDFCDPSPHWKVICLVPDPYTTRGEAATLRDLAARHHWSDAVVLTDPPHVTRTRVWMDRCAAIPVTVVEATDRASRHVNLRGVAYQSAGWVVGQVQSCP